MAPSDRHLELQNLVATWIEARTFKICGFPEVQLPGYIADYAAVGGFFSEYVKKYTKHSGLERKVRYDGEPKGDIDRWWLCVFEVKVSRSDFLNTFGNKATPHAKARINPVGHVHWVVADKGVCSAEELPEFWGLLEPYGSGLTEKKMPILYPLPDEKFHAISFDMFFQQMNMRRSYHYQIIDMTRAIMAVWDAIESGSDRILLRSRAEAAVSTCRNYQKLNGVERADVE